MKKRGVSTIVVVIILIALVLIALGILWTVINKILKEKTEEVSLETLTVDAEIKGVEVDTEANNISISVRRKPGGGNLIGFKFVFNNGTDNELHTVYIIPSMVELEERFFTFNLSMNVSEVLMISLVPIIKSGDKELPGVVIEKYNIKTGRSVELPTEPEAVCGNNITEGTEICDGTDLGGENCTTQGYDSGNLSCLSSCLGYDTSACNLIEPECGDGLCETGENCSVDSVSCLDNTCYEPTCTNGCGQTPVSSGGNDEGCISPLMCDGVGSCVECVSLSDCDEGESCIGGNCVVQTGDIVYATSCSQSDVQAAIDSAQDGDTVQIPDGSCTWVKSGEWGESAISISNKAIILKGNGVYAVDSNHQDTGSWPLTITLSVADGGGISINGASGDFIRITGIHFTGSAPGGFNGGAIVVETSNRADWRVDNCKVTASGNSLLSYSSGLGGLVDHIYIYDSGCSGSGSVVAMDKRNSYEGNWIFTQPVEFGSSNFVFVEDSTFWQTCTSSGVAVGVTDAQAGGKFVFRHNYVRDSMVMWHGTESGAPERGGYAFEVYNNEFYWTMPSDRYHCTILQRGGTALVYNNIATNYQALWKTWVRRASESWGIFGQCDGSEIHDGNWGGSYPSGYPCLDQVGRGQASGEALGDVQPQEESKCYVWSNTLTNTDTVHHNNPDYVVEGRDYEYCDDDSCAPTGYTSYPYPHPLQG